MDNFLLGLWISYTHVNMGVGDSWKRFVTDFEKSNNSPILLFIFKKTSLSSLSESQATLSCKNEGMRLFLEARKVEIEGLFSSWIGRVIKFRFTSKSTVKSKKQKGKIPLLQFKKDKDVIMKRSQVQSLFSFKNFAVSNSNQIAYTAAMAVSNNPGDNYNPLFIYGGVGFGKTHLLQAVANKILERDVDKKILYCSSEEFTNDLIGLIRAKNTARFRKKYRSLDVLLVDDIQFIAGKNYVQEEFYHTFNTLIQKKGQIVLTSDRPPKEIKKLEDRLQSRFSGGLTIDVQRPDFELRCAIILIKAKERKIEIEMEAAKAIAEKITDTRELEGKILEMYAKTLKERGCITKKVVVDVLERREEEKIGKIDPQTVLKYVASYYNIKPSSLKGKTRKEAIVLPRQIAMFVLRNILRLKYEEIAFFLKRKDHTTVMHGVNKITKTRIQNPALKEDIDKITAAL